MSVEIFLKAFRSFSTLALFRSSDQGVGRSDADSFHQCSTDLFVPWNLTRRDGIDVDDDLIEHYGDFVEEGVEGSEGSLDGGIGREGEGGGGGSGVEGGDVGGEEIDSSSFLFVDSDDGFDGKESEMVGSGDGADGRSGVGSEGESSRIEGEMDGGGGGRFGSVEVVDQGGE